jgi:phage terminase large subunit GpA-like protein
MDNWAFYAQQYVNANPKEGKRKEKKHQTFKNVVLGETYQQSGKSPKANVLQKNIRTYDIRAVPDEMSIRDGNGHIVLLTCACDLGGYAEDCRLDYEVVGWSESGSTYSILHGSIGTFIPLEGSKKYKKDREPWTYEFGRKRSVWPEFDKVLNTVFVTDGGRRMKIALSGMDTGYFTKYANHYLDESNFPVVGLKGDKEYDFRKFGIDKPVFKAARERSNSYLVDVNAIKDSVSENIELKWNKGHDPNQPNSFMNFPTPSEGLYLFDNYFSHFEAEHKVLEEKDGKEDSFLWKKKTSRHQNHLWDCHIYNHAIRAIFLHLTFKELKVKEYTWNDYVKLILQNR